MSGALVAFSAVALLLVLMPGPDFAVVVPNALRGRKSGTSTAFGTASGLAVHAGIAAAGLSAIVLASDLAFSIVKYLGAIFLVLMGIRAILKSRPSSTDEASASARRTRSLSLWGAYRQGLMVNVLNPKAPLIYLSIMPQFLRPNVSAAEQILAMSAILVGLALAWYLSLTFLVSVLRPILERFSARIAHITGGVLIILGIRTALESRPV